MKIRIVQQVSIENRPETYKNIYKDFESDVIPHKGDFITDPAFKDPDEYEVHSVTIDYGVNLVQVLVHSVILETEKEEAVKEYVEMMKKHDWKCDSL